MDRNYNVITFISDTVIFRKPRVANFNNIIKIEIALVKITFKANESFISPNPFSHL